MYLRPSQRYADLVIEGPFIVLAIETESRFSSALKGVAQAAIYAEGIKEEYPNKPVYPLVLVPDGHVEEPERTFIQDATGVPILSWHPA